MFITFSTRNIKKPNMTIIIFKKKFENNVEGF